MVAQHVQVLVGDVAAASLDERPMISSRSSGVVSRRLAFRHWVTAASQPTRLKTKTIAGSRPWQSSRSTTSKRLGSVRPRAAAGRGRRPGVRGALRLVRRSRVRRGPPVVAGDPHQLRVDLASGSVGAVVLEQVVHPPADHHVLVERHRPALLDDRRGLAADRLQPLAELLGVGHRRGQRDQRHRLGQVDDHLLPDRAAEPVGEVVHLVHHDVAEPGQRRGAGVEHVAQHLGGHHHDRRLAVDGVVPGEQADLVGAVPSHQVGELLVRQRLDRGGVEALAALLQRQVHGELADQRLARPGRRRDQHAAAGLELLAGPDLEVVEREVVQLHEVGEHRRALLAPEPRVALSGRGRHQGTSTFSASGATSTVSGSAPRRSPSAYATMPGAATVTLRTRWCSYCGCRVCLPVNSCG